MQKNSVIKKQSSLTKLEIKKKFIRAFIIIRVIYRLKLIFEDIQTFGTSSNLFDLTTRDRAAVKKVNKYNLYLKACFFFFSSYF